MQILSSIYLLGLATVPLDNLTNPVKNFFRVITADLNPVDRVPERSIRETARCLGNEIKIKLEPYEETLNRLLHRRSNVE